MTSSVPSLTSLLKQSHIDDHEDILKAAESTLKQSKGDLQTQHVKAVALLKLDRYDDALRVFETGGDKLKDKARLEYAYTLYKSGKPAEAADVASQSDARGYKHVEAQARYRTEDFQRAAELYQELEVSLEDDAEADLRINTGAVDAQSEWAGYGGLMPKRSSRREDMDSFEIMYNSACGSIAKGELGKAEVLLTRAKNLCSALEDLSEEEKRVEMLPITVQQVCVLARLGRREEAEALAKSLDTKDIPDASTRHIALVNEVAASAVPANPFLAQRLVGRDVHSLRPDHPFQFQSTLLQQNKHASDLQSLKFGGTAESTAQAISKQPLPNLDAYYNSLSVVNAAAHAKSQTGKEALKHILPLLEKRPGDVGLILTIVQLYVLTGNSGSAITLLETFFARLEQSGSASELDVRYAPGLVAVLVSLYHSSSRRGHMRTEFARAATHWRRKSRERSTGTLHLLKAAGSALLESTETEHIQLANEIFSQLHAQDESDRYAAAGLLAASPQSTTSKQRSSLQPIDRLIAGIDTDALESAGIAQPPSSAGPSVTVRKRPAEESKSKPAKKIRKSRLPKDYDPSKPPDPERWLPLRDRSSYRPKGKKGKARQNLLSQGSAPAGESDGSRPATPGAEVVKAKQQQGPGGGKKKKGKGGKW